MDAHTIAGHQREDTTMSEKLDQATATMIRNLEERTGKNLDQWMQLVKKTYVSLRRSKQFALVQPPTKTRVDVGINLKGVAPAGRLEASGSFNSMVSHRVRIESVKDVDKELVAWLKQAYESA
jgi:hypothetical protein